MLSFFCSTVLFGQLDSLNNELKKPLHDTVKINIHLKIASESIESDTLMAYHAIENALRLAKKSANKEYTLRVFDRAVKRYVKTPYFKPGVYFAKEGIALSKKWRNYKWTSMLYARYADLLQQQGFSKQSLPFFDSALFANKKLTQEQIAYLNMQKGRAYYDIGEYKPAMDLYVKAQKIFEKEKLLNKTYGHLLHYIGSVFKRQDLYDKALVYYEKELDLAKQLNDKHLEAEALYLCASMYGQLGNLEKELEYNLKSLEIYKEENDERGIPLMLGNISSNYGDRKDYKQAINYLNQALVYYEKSQDKEKLAWVNRALGDNYSRLNQHAKAIGYFKKAMEANAQTESKALITASEIQKSLAFAYARTGNYKDAFNAYLEHRTLEDSINNKDNREYLHELETKYQTEKKEQEIALLQKDKKMQATELALKNAETERHKAQQIYFIIGGILVLAIAGISLWAFLNKKKANTILAKQFEEIAYKNIVIREKNKDITDSINYAKRIQEAVLPQPEELNAFFSDSFIFYRPKDIVSGDFYWFNQIGDDAILAVGDCTGHGVPGAFMSIIGHDLLNQVVLEDKIHNPAEILRALDKRVTLTLNKRGSKYEYQDGMDIAVCLFKKKEQQLVFSGANRPLLVKKANELIELPPNKFSIGGTQDSSCKLFYQHQLELNANDFVYMFSDGYQDQFGGASGKKLKYHQLKQYITKLTQNKLADHKEMFTEMFDNWKGDIEQVDDVCVIGIKF